MRRLLDTLEPRFWRDLGLILLAVITLAVIAGLLGDGPRP